MKRLDSLQASAEISDESLIINLMIGLLYPFMLLFGFYIIVNGHYTPGGGFQGGSILATLFVARYVVYPVDDTDSEMLHTFQRFFLVCIVLVPLVVLFSGLLSTAPRYNSLYLSVMDMLIGIQVGFGLGVAVLRFAFFEGVGKTWHL